MTSSVGPWSDGISVLTRRGLPASLQHEGRRRKRPPPARRGAPAQAQACRPLASDAELQSGEKTDAGVSGPDRVAVSSQFPSCGRGQWPWPGRKRGLGATAGTARGAPEAKRLPFKPASAARAATAGWTGTLSALPSCAAG